MSINPQLIEQNYFSLFELPLVFKLDLVVLKHSFLRLQQLYHPDNFAQASSSEKTLALQLSSNINAGFNVLQNAVSRGQYLLKLMGVVGVDTHNPVLPQSTIFEQIELREELEIHDDTSNDVAVLKLIEAAKQSALLLEERIALLIDGSDIQNVEAFEQAKVLLFELQFYNKFIQEALQVELRLLDDF